METTCWHFPHLVHAAFGVVCRTLYGAYVKARQMFCRVTALRAYFVVCGDKMVVNHWRHL